MGNTNTTQAHMATSNAISHEGKDAELQSINEEIYKRNLELAVTNKTLSLLRKLYQISLLTLDPRALSEKITETIRFDLNFELTGILLFDKEKDTLTPLTIATSPRMLATVKEQGIILNETVIPKIHHHDFFESVLYGKTQSTTDDLSAIWGGVLTEAQLSAVTAGSHIKTMLVYPLYTETRMLGSLFLGLNREYSTLSTYEKESIKSFIPVIAVAFDKAYLYKELENANEKLKGLDKLKTEFLSLASHQLRSPLTAIKGYTSMLLDGSFGSVNEKQKEAIDRVFQSSQHLTKVVEDLLNVSKIEQGGMKYEMAPFDFTGAAKSLAEDLSITAEKKGLKLRFSSDATAGYTVNGDMEKIRQVILNLIDNAIKYTQAGAIDVSVTKTPLHRVLFAVHDSGMGVSSETIKTLFQKFNRGEGGKINTGGSGLGLYLAKEIVEAHKGKVWVESAGVGLGSTFMFELPLTEQLT